MHAETCSCKLVSAGFLQTSRNAFLHHSSPTQSKFNVINPSLARSTTHRRNIASPSEEEVGWQLVCTEKPYSLTDRPSFSQVSRHAVTEPSFGMWSLASNREEADISKEQQPQEPAATSCAVVP